MKECLFGGTINRGVYSSRIYILFEGVLIPMFIIIGIWRSREEKLQASNSFF